MRDSFVDTLPDGGRRIFDLYGLRCDTRGKQRATYREDANPSVSVSVNRSNVVVFYDFGISDGGDAIKLLQHHENCSTTQAIERAKEIYNIAKTHKNAFLPKLSNRTNIVQPPRIYDAPKAFLEAISFRDFSAAELNYWKDKTAGLVTESILNAYNVRSVNSNEVIAGAETKRFNSVSHYFAFESSLEGYYKIVTPLRKDKDGNRQKSFYLQTRAAAENRTIRYSFGLEQLRSGVAYLCEGEADTLCLLASGFNAFTFGGVTNNLKESERALLVSKGITRIVVVFDNDDAGRENARKLCSMKYEEFSVVAATLPPKLKGKDVCDYVQQYGIDNDFRDALHKSTLERRGCSVETIERQIEKHINGKTREEIELLLEEKSKVYLIAPTGAGKTTAAIEIARNNSKRGLRTVLALPTTLAAAQVGDKFDILCLSSSTGLDELAMQQAKADSIVVTTWDSLKHCGQIDCLIIDEAHLLASSQTYRAAAVRNVFYAMQNADTVLAMTGTPETLFCSAYGFTPIRLLPSQQQKIKISMCGLCGSNSHAVRISKTNLRIATAVSWIKSEVERGQIAVVRYKNKDVLKKIAKALNIPGVYSITSSDKQRGNSEVFESIKTSETMPKDCKVLLCTNSIDTAINIRGTNFSIASFDEKNSDDLIQFAARFRDMEEISFTLFYAKYEAATLREKTVEELYNETYRIAKAQADYFNTLQVNKPELLRAAIVKTSNSFDLSQATYRFTDGNFTPSLEYCYSHAVLETSERTTGDVEQSLKYFSLVGIAKIDFVEAKELLLEGIENVEKASSVVDEETKALRLEVFEQIKTNEFPLLRAVYTNTFCSTLKAAIKERAGTNIVKGENSSIAGGDSLLRSDETESILSLYLEDIADGFSKTDALHISQNLSGSNSRANFKKQLVNLQLLAAESNQLNGKLMAQKIELKKIVDSFRDGEVLTGAEIVVRVKAITTYCHIKPRNAVSLVRALFAASRSGKLKKYKIGRVTSVEDFCKLHGVQPPQNGQGDTSPLIKSNNKEREVSPSNGKNVFSLSAKKRGEQQRAGFCVEPIEVEQEAVLC